MEDLYRKIPPSECKEGCFACCIQMIQFTPSEYRAMGSYDYHGICPHLDTETARCKVYQSRPLVCRLYGASELLRCEDCTAEKYLSEEETRSLLREYLDRKKKEEQASTHLKG